VKLLRLSAHKQQFSAIEVLENSAALLSAARDSGCTVIHAPISFEPGHDEIADTAYGILAGVKEGKAFTKGEWGADFSGTVPFR
jgi:nicotinamidase-related amidase